MFPGANGELWTATLVFVQYNDEEVLKTTVNPEDLLDHFQNLDVDDERILKAWIWKHALPGWPGCFGDWHEYIVVESDKGFFWSFEKRVDAIHVQRSRSESDVKFRLNGRARSSRIKAEGRSDDAIGYGDSIYDVIEWIQNRDALHDTFNLRTSNCHFFPSMLYEAIVRDKGRRLDNCR